jgi:chromate reductase, NAD(P)H dehydrogenase (quinone)
MAMSDAAVKVLGISGSLRKGSYNTAALRTVAQLLPDGMVLETGEIRDLPLYDEDVKAAGFPSAVDRLAAQVKAADALLFVTPEYNFSIPGVLKNAIDWVSRVPGQPFAGKPVAMMGASAGMLGSARAQYHLRQVCVFLNMFPINKPEVFIGQAQTKFDGEGRLTDPTARDLIAQLLVALRDWTRRLRGPG